MSQKGRYEFELPKLLREISIGYEIDYDLQSKVFSGLILDINTKKEEILKQALSRYKIVIDPKEEEQRRFKRLSVTKNQHKETWYYNDGSIDGKKLVTFTTLQKQVDNQNIYSLKLKHEIH